MSTSEFTSFRPFAKTGIAVAAAALLTGAAWHGLSANTAVAEAPQAVPSTQSAPAIAGGRTSYADVVKVVTTVQVRTQEDVRAVEEPPPVANVRYQHADYEEALAGTAESDDDGGGTAVAAPPKAQPFARAGTKVGRNDPCPCGSGKKYKQCHGRLG